VARRTVRARPAPGAAWEHRANLRTYDALYVALAEVLDATLLTADARLAAAPGIACRVEVASSDG